MRLTILAITAALVAGSGPAVADVLKLPDNAQAQSGPVYQMPTRGMNMAQVARQFGKPVEKLAPVGKPPITRWIYPDFTVYFERNRVIESVKNKVPRAAPSVESPGAPARVPSQGAPARLTDMP